LRVGSNVGPLFQRKQMYPLNLALAAPAVGFACANDEAEHKALSEAGYRPAFVAPAEPKALDRDELLIQAEAKGVKVDKRWSDARLTEEVAKA
jgi:hypothetical protein